MCVHVCGVVCVDGVWVCMCGVMCIYVCRRDAGSSEQAYMKTSLCGKAIYSASTNKCFATPDLHDTIRTHVHTCTQIYIYIYKDVYI